MKTPMLKRRLNPFLLVSTVLILSLLAGLSVLYQGQLNNLVTDKKDLKQQLNEKDTKISELEQEKKNLTRQIREKDNEIQRLKSLLASKKQEVEKLSQQVTRLQNQLEQASSTSNTTRQINDTLGFICGDSENQLSSDSRDLCELRGHDTS